MPWQERLQGACEATGMIVAWSLFGMLLFAHLLHGLLDRDSKTPYVPYRVPEDQ
jgi:hypothetical protein